MKLRPATVADIPTLVSWDSKPHVIAASGDDGAFEWAEEIPRQVDWREILIAEVDGRPVGVMQVIDPAREETHYWGDVESDLRAIDIWIGEERDLGKGYGTGMMTLVLQRCFSQPEVKAILIDPLAANTRAIRFYERLGFKQVERRTFGTDDCYVYRLDRADWERAHPRAGKD